MDLNHYVIDEHDFGNNSKRRLRTGHTTQKIHDRILCKCGWFLKIEPPMELEEAEELAWLHVTEPSYIIKGSSDLLLPGRLQRAKRRATME